MPSVLIVGATRGLGSKVAEQYQSGGFTVHGTARSATAPSSPSIIWHTNIDLTSPHVGSTLASSLSGTSIDIVVLTAGYFATETFDSPDFHKEVQMYTTSAIAPVLVVSELVKSGIVGEGGKIIIVSSESGSIALRHASEGGGNYGHHASKAASNMVVKLLSLDLADKKIAIASVHVSLSAFPSLI